MGSEDQDWWKWSGPSRCLKNFNPLLQPKTGKGPTARRLGRKQETKENVWIGHFASSTPSGTKAIYRKWTRELWPIYLSPLLHHSPSFLISKAGVSCLPRCMLWSPASPASSSSVFILPFWWIFLLAHTHAEVSPTLCSSLALDLSPPLKKNNSLHLFLQFPSHFTPKQYNLAFAVANSSEIAFAEVSNNFLLAKSGGYFSVTI